MATTAATAASRCEQALFITNRHTTEVSFQIQEFVEAYETTAVLRDSTQSEFIAFPQGKEWIRELAQYQCGLPGDPQQRPSGTICTRKCKAPVARVRMPADPERPLPLHIRAGAGGPLMKYTWHSPSEHTLDGGYFPMEMHMVHGKGHGSTIVAVFIKASSDLEEKCRPTTKANQEKYRYLADLSVNIEDTREMEDEKVQCRKALWMDHIQKLMPDGKSTQDYTTYHYKDRERQNVTGYAYYGPRYPESYVRFVSPPLMGEEDNRSVDVLFNMKEKNFYYGLDPYSTDLMIVGDLSRFYTYVGSTTTPPCQVGVTWIISPKPFEIFASTLKYYRKHIQLVDTPPKGFGDIAPSQLRQFPPPIAAWNKDAGTVLGGDAPNFAWKHDLGTNNRPLQEQQVLHGTESKRVVYYLEAVQRSKKYLYINSADMMSSGVPRSSESSLDSSQSGSWEDGEGESDSDSSGSADQSSGNSSMQALGSMGSGSSGFYMADWKWAVIMGFACCSCIFFCRNLVCCDNEKVTLRDCCWLLSEDVSYCFCYWCPCHKDKSEYKKAHEEKTQPLSGGDSGGEPVQAIGHVDLGTTVTTSNPWGTTVEKQLVGDATKVEVAEADLGSA
jgi:hypothetical protein